MKKIFAMILLLIFVFAATSCSGEDENPQHKEFCYTASSEQPYDLTENTRQYITGIFGDLTWVNDITNCESDFVFYIQDREIHYHSSCGTFNDYTNKKSSTVSSEQSAIINSMLGLE